MHLKSEEKENAIWACVTSGYFGLMPPVAGGVLTADNPHVNNGDEGVAAAGKHRVATVGAFSSRGIFSVEEMPTVNSKDEFERGYPKRELESDRMVMVTCDWGSK